MTAASGAGGTFDIRPTLAGRATAFGLVLVYLAVFAALLAAFVFGLAASDLAPAVRAHRLTPWQSFLREWADAVAAVLAVVILAGITREPLSRFGFATKGAWRVFPTGVLAGLRLMAALVGALAVLGAYQFAGSALTPGRLLGFAGLYVLFDFGVAVFEETLFRSFILVQLSRAIGFWPSAIVTAVLFGLAHAGNLNEAPFGLAVAGLGGLVLAYAFRRTGAIWFAIGFHAALAYSEDYIFGVPDSGGNAAQGALLHASARGPLWLSGGGVGPEGSILALAVIALLALVVRFGLARRTA